jgi:oligopeptide/dipeptide ABC transporter ATP-binding protein
MTVASAPPTRRRSALAVNALSVRFPIGSGRARRQLRAIDGVDLEVFPGEALGLVGESGCGKSTLARVAVGLQMPSEGSVLLDGREIPERRDQRLQRRVQLVFQDPTLSLNPRLTVGQALSELLVVHQLVPRKAVTARVAELLTLVDLPAHMVDAYPRRMSGGQRQRVAIARALALEPDVLVADEPVASLDVSVQATVCNLLDRLRTELDLSLLFISHDLSVVHRLCSRVAVMYLGRIVEVAPTEELFSDPQHPYTRGLIDAIPRLHERRSEALAQLDGDPPSPVDLPVGCRFAPRCLRSFDACVQDPALLPATTDQQGVHAVACHLDGRPTPKRSIPDPTLASNKNNTNPTTQNGEP